MDFARKQLEKYGWSEGKGLGRNEDGIQTAIKPSLKFDNSGLGHDVGAQFTSRWWEKLFDNAANNIKIEQNSDEVQMTLKSKSVEITNKDYSLREMKENNDMEYGSFLKTAKLTGSTVEQYDVSLAETQSAFKPLTDEELFAACGGRTGHKGARHGLKLGGKLSRIEKQEKMLLKKMKKVSLSDNEPDKSITQKKLKKLRKQKDSSKEKFAPVMEDSMESTSSCGLKKKKKKKSVSFSETVTVTPIYQVDLDTSFESEISSTKGDNGNDSNLELGASASDEGIEQDAENNNTVPDNHRSFEVRQFNINDLSKAERKKLKKKRKLESKKNTSTGRFLQNLKIDTEETDCAHGIETKDVSSKKRKFREDIEQSEPPKTSKNKSKEKRKRRKKVEEKINSIVETLDAVCRISESE